MCLLPDRLLSDTLINDSTIHLENMNRFSTSKLPLSFHRIRATLDFTFLPVPSILRMFEGASVFSFSWDWNTLLNRIGLSHFPSGRLWNQPILRIAFRS